MTPEQYQANYEEILETINNLKQEAEKRSSLLNIRKGLVEQIRTIFLFGLITPEQEQLLYKEICL